ncbi:DUF4952 domain-containing protein [Sphingomonas sp. ASY06-1R]|jgi:hypothetical protein|uniref:DUF4952 domain-containing protein n=1 Tax=Sphingomonas sp. ASY06-1R TaxID=3445771 RepID=UPI003FA1EBEC
MIGAFALLLAQLASAPGLGHMPPRPVGSPLQACADVLAQMRRTPPHVRFIGCRLRPHAQGRPLRATYRVEGRRAAAAETYLIRTLGLAALRRSCCQRDSPPHTFVDATGRTFTLAMVSDESGVTDRSQWKRIAHFEIIVETFTEAI